MDSPGGADWSPDSELKLKEMLMGAPGSDELKKRKTSITKEMINDVISKANKPLSSGEILWRLMLQPDLDASSNLEQSGTSVTSQIESQMDWEGLLSAIDEQIAKHSSEPSRESTRQDDLESLLSHKCRLEKEIKEWNDWGTQKVMQAAKRLSKDRDELLSLRKEKWHRQLVEEHQRQHGSLMEEHQRQHGSMMEEYRRQQCSLMEEKIALAKGLEVKARTLELLNDQLRMELKDAELHAAEAEENCKTASRRMEENFKKLKSSQEEKLLFKDELAAEKRRFYHLQQQLERAKDLQDIRKSEWKKEEKLKNEALEMAMAIRKEREQIEMSAKSQENALKIEEENNLQRYKNEIRQLENQIAQLKLVKSSSSDICVPRWEAEGSNNASNLPEEESKSELKREWECVMCLSEIVSVVFLPCAHQVFCRKCNELHEQKGVKECPSCRTPIQRRVLVRSADDL